MKKLLLAVLFCALSPSVFAVCQIQMVYQRGPAEDLLKRHWNEFNVPDYDSMCLKLQRANAAIEIAADAKVLAGTSIGFARLRVVDRSSGLGTIDYTNGHIRTDPYASQDEADKLMLLAVQDSLNDWTHFDGAVASLVAARKSLR
ncbi:hypothetical protein [Paraburkholderia sp. SIMBA_054]|uniref:hypothetical protein n=1 Tax=Paraburkholderia sp. SIMBA_054 TaxID=3085795 RepID=UPI00397BFBCC